MYFRRKTAAYFRSNFSTCGFNNCQSWAQNTFELRLGNFQVANFLLLRGFPLRELVALVRQPSLESVPIVVVRQADWDQ